MLGADVQFLGTDDLEGNCDLLRHSVAHDLRLVVGMRMTFEIQHHQTAGLVAKSVC